MTRSLLTLIAACLLCSACSMPKGPLSSFVEGKMTLQAAPQAGVVVEAYPVEVLSLDSRPPYRSTPTASDGLFRLELPAGEYYLLARGEGLFAYFGRNPIAVSRQGTAGLNVGMVRTDVEAQPFESFARTGVAGQVLLDGRPLAGATVYVYTDLSSRLKGMGYVMAGPTDEMGRFEAELPPGTYYLLVRQRQGRGMTGPLRAGDHIGYLPSNPMIVRAGELLEVAVPVLEVPGKVERLAGSLFGATAVRGRVIDGSGQPVSGMRVLLYDDPQMFNRPLFVSKPTAADGSFVLSFPYGGTYFLAARNTLGGAPSPGDLYGSYHGTGDHSLTVETGRELEGIEIVVEEMW